jgi:stage II sporulation protein Q
MREEENKKPSRKKVVKLLRKRWIFPALYLASAAVLITGALLYQYATTGDNTDKTEEAQPAQSGKENPAVPVTKVTETIKMPVEKEDAVTIAKKFYRDNASVEEQQSALIQHGNSFEPNTGINLVAKDKKEFNVVAALSGKVEKAEQDALLGNVVVVKHEDGLTTLYQGLGNVVVAAGDAVKQGQVLGKAGQSVINKDDGIHVHFEIRQNNVAINPEEYFNKAATDVKATAGKKEEVERKDAPKEDAKKETPAMDREKQGEPKKPADEKKDPQN